MGREIRRVPANWQHPESRHNQYQPLMNDYVGSLKYYKDAVDQFIKAMTEVIQTGKATLYDREFTDRTELYEWLTEDGELDPPNIERYMPEGEWYQLFETVSEGTPLTPAFAKPEELVEYLVQEGDFWKKEPWPRNRAEAMVREGFTMSGVITNGKMYQNEEVFDVEDDKK